MPTLTIVVGSTRPGRSSLPISLWFAERARAHGGFDVQVADLAELDLPLMNEPMHPLFQQYSHDHTKEWSTLVAGSDAFVFVSPEYNHSFGAPLKNAIDYLHVEWYYKPVGFVSYGGVAGGTRAVGALKPVVSALKMTPLTESVILSNHAQFINEDGEFQGNDGVNLAALGMLNELAKMEAALRPLRS